jgi:hypothetical protein
MVVSLWPRRAATLRFVSAAGRHEERVARGAFTLLPIAGDLDVSGSVAKVRGHGHAGSVGVLIDARGRPLSLPQRDAERIPALSRWHATVRASPPGRP